MSREERQRFNETWTQTLFAGGWICAGWPIEYGGKGLGLMDQVVLNEEFAKANAPMRADFFRLTRWWGRQSSVGYRRAEEGVHPGIFERHDRLVSGIL